MHFVLATGHDQGRSLAFALALAHGLRSSATAQHFIVGRGVSGALEHTGYRSTLVDPAVDQHVRRVIEEAEREFRPQAIVLVDDLAFDDVTRNELALQPQFVHDFGVPVVPLAIGPWRGANDAVPGQDRSRNGRWAGRYFPRLLPVPLARPEPDPGAGDYPFPLLLQASEGVDENWGEGRRVARERLGLCRRDRLVVVPSHRLARRLTALPQHTRVVVRVDAWTAVISGDLGRPPAGAGLAARSVLQAADAVVATSIRSVILAHAVHLGIPGLVVTGDHGAETAAAGDAGAGRPDDPYLGAVPRLRAAEAYRSESPLCELLSSGLSSDVHLEARKTYLEQVRRLGSTAEVFASAVARAVGSSPSAAG
jgi:hypothetical protein